MEGKERIAVIVPPVVVHHLDAHTGIPFMPHMAAYLAAILRDSGYDINVVDSFGEGGCNQERDGEFMMLGLTLPQMVDRISVDCRVAFVYCRNVEEIIAIESLMEAMRSQRPDTKICLFENVQSVNAYSLEEVARDLLPLGGHAAILGEPELRVNDLVRCLAAGSGLESIPGIVYRDDERIVSSAPVEPNRQLDELPFPAWDAFQLDGYWQAGFGHAPVDGRRFLPLLTSRGCPYKCTFCVAPALNPVWRGRSAQNVVDEMAHFHETMGVTDFHVSDLDPTISDRRIREMCELLIERDLPITWKLAQGTKIETIKSEDTLDLMARAGCTFIAFSPESGSPKMLKAMKKPFDHEHGLRMVRKMNGLGIRTQACFIAGVPGEDEEDRDLSVAYVRNLVSAGVDEIAVYVFAPLPGTALSQSITGYDHYSQLSRSPTWRSDYREVARYRRRMYATFFLSKIIRQPSKVLREARSFIRRRFQTKMEMSVYKQLKIVGLRYAPSIWRRLEEDFLRPAQDSGSS